MPRPPAPLATVLVVENDAPIRALTAAVLSLARFEVHAAPSISDAAAILASVVPDVAVVDLELPGHDTRDALDALRSEAHQGTRVVGIAGAEQRVAPEIADAILRKPGAVALLPSVLAALVPDPDARDDAPEAPRAGIGERVFVREGGPSLGLVRAIGAHHFVASVRGEDVVLPHGAIAATHEGKLVLDLARVDPAIRPLLE